MQVLVIGAGVVGLAVARAAALAGHDVVVAEAASGIGTGVSSRNSEVIHAGLYYPTGSLRAYHCPCGRRMLYDFCASHGVPHRRCGKLVVATNAGEVERLAPLHKQAQVNGVEGVELIDAAAANSNAATRIPVLDITELRQRWISSHEANAAPASWFVANDIGTLCRSGHFCERLAIATPWRTSMRQCAARECRFLTGWIPCRCWWSERELSGLPARERRRSPGMT